MCDEKNYGCPQIYPTLARMHLEHDTEPAKHLRGWLVAMAGLLPYKGVGSTGALAHLSTCAYVVVWVGGLEVWELMVL